MKIYLVFILLFFREASTGPAKKGPAFSTPVYSDSFLPAAMQVIFYAVEQLKSLQVEETEQTTTIMSTTFTTTVSTTMSHEPGQQQPEATAPSNQLSTEKPGLSQEASIVEMENSNDNPSTPSSDKEMPEMGEETPEINYGTPETNHEIPEESHETQEVNQETPQPEKDITLVDYSKDKLTDSVSTTSISVESQQSNKSNSSSSSSSSSSEEASSEEDKDEKIKNKKEPTVDSVVQEIYGIMKPQNKTKNSSEESESNESRESNDESDEEDNDENRFTLLGEKVTQVPRPSLSTYLRRSKIPPKCSVQQLALLYDALSKDARKQGFAKFSGYSDEVLKTLETSAEGGIGPQLQKLLEKILERNEVTRDDAKVKITGMLKELKEPGSEINKDLRPLLPLRFNP
ncbi:dentin matrix acidic phosphoprotein 1 [Microplitis mediator]|uniref:dentin matrix acidic phosphoprotein 1 n=1 Tax=Microplitis mediator TaxID=375433 RepID=UPI0025546500|nr:dentin matrix acidic phosphoprotein 1 [Microplitis mediator]